jgi:hypothetical protein
MYMDIIPLRGLFFFLLSHMIFPYGIWMKLILVFLKFIYQIPKHKAFRSMQIFSTLLIFGYQLWLMTDKNLDLDYVL